MEGPGRGNLVIHRCEVLTCENLKPDGCGNLDFHISRNICVPRCGNVAYPKAQLWTRLKAIVRFLCRALIITPTLWDCLVVVCFLGSFWVSDDLGGQFKACKKFAAVFCFNRLIVICKGNRDSQWIIHRLYSCIILMLLLHFFIGLDNIPRMLQYRSANVSFLLT